MASENILNNRYRLVAQQGSGGMAVIYKAVDIELGRTVAVKVLRPSLTGDPSGAFLARFKNEARAVANLSHPNIVTVYDVGSFGQTHYMVMEFVEGQDLKKIIRTFGALGIDRVLNLAIQICAGVGFAHRASLVHADVKPQNILMTNEDVVKVTDFGIAQALSDTQPGAGERQSVVWGSPHYFSPEQARGEKPSTASDVYSIGIVLFEMLTGKLPYNGASQQDLAKAHLFTPVPLVTELRPDVPEELAKIVYRAMSKEPAARFRAGDQLMQALQTYRDKGRQQTLGGIAPSRPIAPTESTPQPTVPRQATVPPPLPQTQPGQALPAVPPMPTQSGQPLPFTGSIASTPPPPTLPGQTPIPPAYQGQSPLQAPRPLQDGVYPSSAEVTQRYNVAPEAPQPVQYGNRPAPAGSVSTPYPQGISGDSGMYQPGLQTRDERRRLDDYDAPPALDLVTIVLAGLAFIAVACLIPLYIIVFQRLSG